MGKIGYGYGSEWHLMRLLGRHKAYFDRFVHGSTGASEVSWLDFLFNNSKPWFDNEFKGHEFIESQEILSFWKSFLPNTENVPNWDTKGIIWV